MSKNIAINLLLKERLRIKQEKAKMVAAFNAQIKDLEISIQQIEGKDVWNYDDEPLIYDDNNPDYIKGSAEEM